MTIQKRVSQKENEPNATYDERMRNYEAWCFEQSQRLGKASYHFILSHLTTTRPGGDRKFGPETSGIYPTFKRNDPRPKEGSHPDLHHQVNLR